MLLSVLIFSFLSPVKQSRMFFVKAVASSVFGNNLPHTFRRLKVGNFFMEAHINRMLQNIFLLFSRTQLVVEHSFPILNKVERQKQEWSYRFFALHFRFWEQVNVNVSAFFYLWAVKVDSTPTCTNGVHTAHIRSATRK